MTLTPADVFQPGGLIARRLPGYESRNEQTRMADAVAHAIEREEHLVVEAGTGVGKSFAYLVPAILSTGEKLKDENRSRKIVISTHTISLQEQLISRDVPFLNSVLPVEFSAVLVKGRGNYLSKRRLSLAGEKGAMLFESEESHQLSKIRAWEQDSYDGSLADLGFSPKGTVWDEVRSESGNCLGKKCPTYNDCFYYRARRRVWNADVLIVNHALFFADLALRREGASVLPEYDVVVFDEAHTLEDVAASHMGMSIANGQFNYLFNKLCNERLGKGLLVQHQLIQGQQLVSRLRFLVDQLFDEIDVWRDNAGAKNGRVLKVLDIENPVSHDLFELSAMLRDYAADLKSDAHKLDLNSSADRLDLLGTSLTTWLRQKEEDSVYWVETSGGRYRNVKLMSSPVDVGSLLREEMFGKIKTVILTSATLSVGKNDFSFYRNRVGLTKANELKLGSPFNYKEQVQLIIESDMPDPGSESIKFEQAVCEKIQKHILATGGAAFVLFTSYRMLKNCASKLTRWMVEQNLLLLTQGDGVQRTELLEQFRKDGNAVLFGTESFWQGIDVPGDALRNVIITKLPFSVPDHPLLEARVERIKEGGGNPFVEYQVPEAAIKLRQGFGRLIRTATDTGRVVILDPRIKTKPYGRIFMESLPDCGRGDSLHGKRD